MTVAKEVDSVRAAVAVFNTTQTLQNAIDELLNSGFHRAELSLVASEADVVSKLGHKYHIQGAGRQPHCAEGCLHFDGGDR